MSERVKQGREGASVEPLPNLKHCWVTNQHGRLPGLLLEWRRVASGFQGRVVHPVRDAEGWAVVEEWLPAEMLEPADSVTPRE